MMELVFLYFSLGLETVVKAIVDCPCKNITSALGLGTAISVITTTRTKVQNFDTYKISIQINAIMRENKSVETFRLIVLERGIPWRKTYRHLLAFHYLTDFTL